MGFPWPEDMNTSSKTLLFISNRTFAMTNSRLPILRAFLDQGWEVLVAAKDDETDDILSQAGATLIPLPLERGGIRFIADLSTLLRLWKLLSEKQPRLVHLYNAKPIVMGGFLAFFFPSTTFVATVTGLGHPFITNSPLKHLFIWGFRLIHCRFAKVIFQNPDDQKLFVEQKWINPSKSELIISAGIDTQRFQRRQPFPTTGIVLLAARLLWMKGIKEFIEAAKILKQDFPEIKFQIAGDWDRVHKDSIDESWFLREIQNESIDYLGFMTSPEDLLQETLICVLPSQREGTPRILLEAAACEVPVVTYNVPGCRETVLDGQTGILTEPHDLDALIKALRKLLKNASLREKMGKAGRAFVLENFDSKAIALRHLTLYQSIGIQVSDTLA